MYVEVYWEVYGLEYPRATVVPRTGKPNLYACCTIPDALRPMFNNRRQVYITTGTPDRRTANDKLALLEAEIWEKFDQANLANHPLGAAYTQLVDVVLKGETPWNIEDLFDRDKRILLEDDIRQWSSEAMGFAKSAFDDSDSQAAAQSFYTEAEELPGVFIEEFRKVSE